MDKLIVLFDWIGQDAAHFIGTIIFICVLCEGIAQIIHAIRG